MSLHEAQRYGEALAAFDRAPDVAEAWLGRGRALRRMRRREEAIAAYRQALAKGGDAEVIRYYLATLGAEPVPAAAPRQLVNQIFDRYSERYDQHMVDTLHYRTPDLLAETVRRYVPAGNLCVLDLGCGTGLVGARLRPLARRLSGVDLSASMVALARQRQIYDDLVCGELVEFLQAQSGLFDLVAAADVFVYLGDLSRVLQQVCGATRKGGVFAFSVEASEPHDFALRATLRYAHSAAYVRRLAGEGGFIPESITTDVIRQEDGADVLGHLAVLRRL